MKKLIGLTGKTGSGKSVAANTLRHLGAFVADCDVIAHEVLKDDIFKKRLSDVFSEKILDECGNINRKALGEIVFSDNEKLLLLNQIMHGEITKRAIGQCVKSGKDICVIDGSELESSGVDSKCDLVVVISAEESVRLERIMKRDSISRRDALKRINAQKDYSKDAVIITNNGSEEALEEKINGLFKKISGDLYA